MRIRRLALLLLGIYMLPMLALAWFNHADERRRQIIVHRGELGVMADIQARRVHESVLAVRQLVALLTRRTELASAIRSYQRELDAQQLASAAALLRDALQASERIARIEVLLTGDDTPLLNLGAALPTPETAAEVLGLTDAGPLGPEAAVRTADDAVYFVFSAPLQATGPVPGRLRVYVPGDAITAAARDFTGLGRTGEILIGVQEADGGAVFLAPTRQDPDAALRRRVPARATEVPMIRVLHDLQEPVSENRDYLGVPVFSAARRVPDLGWGVVVKMDRTEVLGGLSWRLWRTIGVTTLIGVLISVLVALLLIRRVESLVEFARQFHSQHPGIPIVRRSGARDELGELSDTLMGIIEHIEASREGLTSAVRESEQALDSVQSQLKTADEALMQAAKFAAIGELSSGIAHEINQPLSALQLKLDSMALTLEQRGDDAMVESLASAQHQVERITQIGRKLLDLARPAQARPEPVDLLPILRRCCEVFAEQFRRRNIELIQPQASGPLMVLGVAGELEQVFINLIGNARDAVAGTARPCIRLLVGQGETVWVRVEDNGPGVPEQVAEHLFENLVTTKPEGAGTGLGLAISHRLVTRSEGTLRLDRSYTQGAAFVVDLKPGLARPRQ